MAFDFRLLDVKKQYPTDRILIDKLSYDSMTSYSKAKELLIENSNGLVILTGYFDLSEVKIEDLVKIQKNSVKFDSKFLEKNSSTQTYQSKKIVITLNDLPISEDFLNTRELKSYINGIPAEIIMKDGKISIISNILKDIDLRPFIHLYKSSHMELDENSDFNRSVDYSGINMFQEDNSRFLIKNIKQKRTHKDEYGANKSFDNERDSIADERKIDNLREDIILDNKIEEDLNFVNFDKEAKEFDFDLKRIPNNSSGEFKFVDPYHLHTDKMREFRKSYFNSSFKVCFNSKGEFITAGKFNTDNFRSKLNVNKVIPNKSLLGVNPSGELNFEYLEYYQNSTLINYLNILNNNLKEKIAMIDSNEEMDISLSPIGKTFQRTNIKEAYKVADLSVNDHTDIIDEYIRDLQNYRTQVKNTQRKGNQETKLAEKFEKEIETLKLFKILFLNCFKSGRESHSMGSVSINQFKSQGEEVKRMRKKKLTDWLVESISTEKRDENKLKQRGPPSQMDQIFGEILNQLLQGRLKKAIEICIKNGLLNLSMILSNTNPSIRSRLISDSVKSWTNINLYQTFPTNLQKIYNLLSGEDVLKADKGKEILTGCNWKQLFLCLSLYSMDQVKDISHLLNEFDTVVNAHANKQDMNLLPQANPGSEVTDINFILIKLFQAIEKNQTAEISKLINTLINSSNIYDEFSDSHLHYILVTVLLNTLENSDQRFILNSNGLIINRSIDFIFMKKIHLKLFTRVIEELLQYDFDSTKTNWRYLISLIKLSNVPENLKNIISGELIFKKIEIAKEDEFFLKKVLDRESIQEAIGLLNYNRFNFKAAFVNFKNSKNFNKANEIFIFSILCLKILDNNVSNETYEELNNLSNYSINSSIWERYGAVLHQYHVLLRKIEGDEIKKLESVDISYLRNLIKKFDTIFIPKNQDRNFIYLINLCRNKILTNLRRIYNIKADLLSKKDELMHICVIPNLTWMNDPNLNLDFKLKEFNSALESQILFKSKVFQDLK